MRRSSSVRWTPRCGLRRCHWKRWRVSSAPSRPAFGHSEPEANSSGLSGEARKAVRAAQAEEPSSEAAAEPNSGSSGVGRGYIRRALVVSRRLYRWIAHVGALRQALDRSAIGAFHRTRRIGAPHVRASGALPLNHRKRRRPTLRAIPALCPWPRQMPADERRLGSTGVIVRPLKFKAC